MCKFASILGVAALAILSGPAGALPQADEATLDADNFTGFQHVNCAGTYLGHWLLLSEESTEERTRMEDRARAALLRSVPADNLPLLRAAEQSAQNIGRKKADGIVDATQGRPRNAKLYALIEEVRACDAAYGHELTAPLYPSVSE